MLIRRPVAEVFEAFIDPSITSKFWFTRGSGKLVQGTAETWHWDLYAATAQVAVRSVEVNRGISIEWPSPVEWLFSPRSDGTTFVSITASGFVGGEDEKVTQAID